MYTRDQILRHARGQGNIIFPCSADHEQDCQPYPVDPYSAICDDHTYIHTYYARRPSHHAIYCTTHAYTYSRRVVQRSGCTCRPPYTHTHTHTYKIHCSHCPSRIPYRTYTRENVAHKPSINSGRTPRPVGSTQPCPGPVRVLYTCVPHSHAQRTRTSVHAQAPYGYCTHAYRTRTHKYTHTSVHMYRAAATHARLGAIWAQLVTLAGQLGRSAQIPLQALIAIGHEVQTTLDQCERLMS